MDEKKIVELRRFISTFTDSKITPFIDLKKLCQSDIYNLAVQAAAEHAAKHNDFGYLEKILALLDGSTHANRFIASLRPTLNVIVTDTKPRRFKKATPQQIAKVAKQAQSKPVVAKKVSPTVIRKVEKAEISQDLMDSRLMLPGAYGTGRRR